MSKKKPLSYRKLRSDIPGLEKLPSIETDISKLIDKDRWKNSKMWNIGVSSRRKKEYKEKIFKKVEELEKSMKKRSIDQESVESETFKRNPEFYRRQFADMLHSAPVDGMPEKIVQRLILLLTKNCNIFNPTDPLFLKEIEELKESYDEIMRRIRSNYILDSGEESNKAPDYYSPALYVDEELRHRISLTKSFLSRNLHTVNPLIQQAMQICLFHIKELMIPHETFKVAEPRSINEYCQEIVSKYSAFEDEMMSFWWPEISLIFSERRNLEKFKGMQRLSILNCVNTLISVKIHNVLLQTLQFILSVFDPKSDHFTEPPFLVRFKVQATTSQAVIVCDPSTEEFQDIFLNLFKQINQVMSSIPKMQCWLEEDSSNSQLNVSITEFSMDKLRDDLRKFITGHYDEISKLSELYMETFEYILSAQSFHDVEDFLKVEQDFFEVCKHLKFYLEKKNEVNNLNNHKQFSLICVDLKFLKAQLVALHDHIIDQLKTASCGMLSNIKKGLSLEFQELEKTLLSVPATAKEMVVLSDFFNQLTSEDFDVLLGKVKDALSKTIVLMNLITLGPEELQLNAEILRWPQKMKPIFKECEKILESAKVRFEEKLAAVIRKVRVDLSNLSQHTGDLEALGDTSAVQEYRREALTLRKRVRAAQAAIQWINETSSYVLLSSEEQELLVWASVFN
ncbi:hypothetical protein JTE90_026797 [Oedothorax gibbosus]|uniref:Uncharacterized protein n=1 Tax=Oedothorax gibbosus TaxID=931172 RepID=A0AAV6UQH2_9ARAC|nr:hypothetical protein JTE90_026797 [Oedothorax gibbosus]